MIGVTNRAALCWLLLVPAIARAQSDGGAPATDGGAAESAPAPPRAQGAGGAPAPAGGAAGWAPAPPVVPLPPEETARRFQALEDRIPAVEDENRQLKRALARPRNATGLALADGVQLRLGGYL